VLRVSWRGHLRLSIINCPVALHRTGKSSTERSMNPEPQWPSFTPSTSVANHHAPPYERLAELNADLREAKARLRQVLEAVADKYDISAKDVSYAIDGYADDMLSDLVFGIQRDLENAAEAETPLRPLSP
jgi:hypothetical protein